MYNKLTKSQKEERLLSLVRLLKEIEFDNNPNELRRHPESKEQIAKWKKFSSLPTIKQQKIWDSWEEYYRKVRVSPIYELYQEIRNALKSRAMGRVRELSEQAAEMRRNGDLNTVQKPTTVDPWEFQRGWVKAYKDTEQKIKELQMDLNTFNFEEDQKVWK